MSSNTELNEHLPMEVRLTSDEAIKHDVLYQAQMVDSEPEIDFDDLAHLATYTCQTPIALISLMDTQRHWIVSRVGLTAPEAHQAISFCIHTSLQSTLLAVEDTSFDKRFLLHPLVAAAPHIRFYAGVPLLNAEGAVLGTLGIMDVVPRQLSSEQQNILWLLSRQILTQLQLQQSQTALAQTTGNLHQAEAELEQEHNLVCKLLDATDTLIRSFVSTVLDTANALVVVLDPDGRVIHFNQLCQQTTHYSLSSAKDKYFWQLFVAPEEETAVKNILEQLKIEQSTTAYECQFIARNGTERTIAWSNTVLTNTEGGIRYIVCNGIDITARKQAQQALRESEEHYRTVVENLKEVIFQLNEAGCWTFLNPAWAEITGFSLGATIGTNILDYIHPTDRACHLEQFQHLIERQREACEYEIRCLTEDGSYRWFEVYTRLMTDANGQVISIFGTFNDVTEYKQAEEVLRENEAQFRKITANVPGAIHQLLLRADGTTAVPFMSPGCCELFELGPSQIQQNLARLLQLVHPDEQADCEASIARAVKQLAPWTWEGRIITPSGQLKWIQGVSRPEIQLNGDMVWNGLFLDITARKQAEAEMLERSRLSTLSAEIGLMLGHSRDVPEILEGCTAAIMQHLNAASVRIWTLDPETNLLELQAITGQNTHTEDFPSRISLGISIIGFIAQTQQAYINNDAANDLCIGAKAWFEHEKIVAFAGHPLVVEERLIGVLALFSQQPLTESVHSTLGWIANSIAVAIDRVWAREALLSRREALLLRLGNQIRNSLDLDTILQTTVTEIYNLLHIDRCHFLWCWPQTGEAILAITHEACHPGLPSLLGEPPTEQVALLAEIILNLEVNRIDDVMHDTQVDPELQSLLASTGVTSQLLLPLETRSKQFGAIVCSHTSGPRPWSNSEVELLQAVTDQLAIAMDQAELYAQTRATALAAQTQAQQLSEALHKLQETQAQLVQNEKMSSLGQLVAGVAHEINNPVNFINGNLVYAGDYIRDLLDLLQLYQKNYPEPVSEVQAKADELDLEFLVEDLLKLLASMKMGGERIRQIVLSLRNFSRLDESDMKPVDIHEGIDSTLLILQGRLKATGDATGIQIIKEYGSLPLVECYAGQLNQVFMNILSNAIDVLEEQPQPRIITIHTEAVKNPNAGQTTIDHVAICIRDNGPGMTEDVRKRLFDPFFTTKPVGKGTGLGLSISYQIVVEKHGGTFSCLSAPGKGAEFWIQIPVRPPSATVLDDLATVDAS